VNHVEKIYIVFKTHVDLGFTDLASNVVTQYREKMMNDVLTVCEETQKDGPDHQYVWTLPAWMLKECLDTTDKEKKKRLEALIHRGQLRWHGLPFTTHTEFCGIEEYIRGLYFSEQLRDQYGHTVISAKMTDVPGHTWMLPTLLKNAGIEFLHLGVNACSSPVELPRLFHWEGPDGSRVLTYYSKGAYGTDLTPPDDWEYPVWLALLQTHDNIGPQNGDVVQELLDEIAKKHPDAEVKIGTMDDFARDFIARDFQDIPVIKKDLADTWIHGIGTYPEEVSRVRRLRSDVSTRESLSALEQLKGNKGEDYSDLIAKAYEHTLLFGEHTWGIDIKSNLLPGRNSERAFGKNNMEKDRLKFPDSYVKTEASWEEQKNYINQAEKALSQVLPFTATNSNIIGVYNPLAWERQDAKITLIRNKRGTLMDRETKEKYSVNEEGDAYIGSIGAMSYRTFEYAESKEPSSAAAIASKQSDKSILENNAIRIEVNTQTGCITSFYDKINHKEWAVDGRFGQYEYDVYGKEEIIDFVKTYAYDLMDWYINDFGKPGYPRISHKKYDPQLTNVQILNGENWGTIKITYTSPLESFKEYGNGEGITVTIRLEDTQSFADIEVTVDQKAASSFAESGHFTFALKADHPNYRFQKLGSVVNPLKDIEKGANSRLHCASHWIDVQEDEAGLAFIPFDTPLFSIGEKGIYQYSKEYIPQQAILHFNLFNNQWGTNFPQWIGGDFRYSFRIAPHAGDWKTGRVQQQATEACVPLQVTYGWNPAGSNANGLFKKGTDSIHILSFKKAEQSDEYILRFQNLLDEWSVIKLSFIDSIRGVKECDLVERNKETVVDFDLNHLTVTMNPFEIKTMKLDFQPTS
jgi:alpha-mannosidase